jgi:hypothetical protein
VVVYGLQVHAKQFDLVAKVIFKFLFSIAAACAYAWVPTCRRSLTRFVLLASLGPGLMLACDCKSPEVAVALKRADAVFTGTAVRIQDLGMERSGSSHRIVVTFQVKTFWKGAVQKTTVMYTRINTSDCDGFLSLDQGKQYIVYGYKKKNLNFKDVAPNADEVLGTWICSRTRELRFAEQDAKELAAGKSPR